MYTEMDLRSSFQPDMLPLLQDYPREAWPDHPNFAQSIQNWLGAHNMFRRLGEITKDDCEAFLDRKLDPTDFVNRLNRFGSMLVGNLHAHHSWEDMEYFPELRRSEKRFDDRLETLEADHELLDKTLHDYADSANRAIKLVQLDEKQAYEEAGKMYEFNTSIADLLNLHLQDEEDLVVPILLHHKLRG